MEPTDETGPPEREHASEQEAEIANDKKPLPQLPETSGPGETEASPPGGPTEDDACGEPASPAAEPEAAPPLPGASTAGSLEEAKLARDRQRGELVDFLFGANRPRPAAAQQRLAVYFEAVREVSEADVAVGGDEAARLLDEARVRHRGAIQSEREGFVQATARIREAVEEHDAFLSRMSTLVADLDEELTRLDVDDPRLETASDELRARLTNYRKGLEIIQRMVARIVERRKPLSPAPPAPLTETLDPGGLPAEPELLAAFAESLCRHYHDVRDANYHAVADAHKHADACRQAMFAAARQLLSAVDGIDSGLANQPELRASLLALLDDESTVATLLDEWLAAYQGFDGHLAHFFEDVGIVAHTVQPGTRFDPERMEPQAAVAHPELQDEDVAAMVRRGFSVGDEPIRPIIVDVVRNR